MRRSSSNDNRKSGLSAPPSRVTRPSSAKKPQTIGRFPSTDRLSSGRFSTGQNGARATLYTGRTSVGKTSMGGNMAKRMSHGMERGRGELRDSRPLSSRAFQQRCVKNLYEFLTEYGFPGVITPKILLSPTTKDFLKVFEFIVKQIEYKYKIPDKYDEEIPRYLRVLGYPFLINRSSMFTVGSPHTWPALLAALCWLVELYNIGLTMNEDIDSLIFPEDFDGDSDSKIRFNFLVEGYKTYMEGSDNFEEIDKKLNDAYRKKYFGEKGLLDKMEYENSDLSEKLREYEEHADRLQELQETNVTQDKDLVQMNNYLAELQAFESKLDLEGETNEVRELESELESQRCHLKTLQTVFDNQEYTPTDVERFRMEEQQLQSQIDALDKDNAQLDEELWNDEMQIAKFKEKLNERCCQHNKQCRTLELIPENAKHANGLDFELKPNLFGSTQDQFQKHKSQLLEVKNKIASDLHAENAEKRKLENILEQEVEQVEEMSAKVRKLQTDLKRMEEAFKSDKHLYEQSIGSKQALYDQEYEELNDCYKTVQQLEHDIDLLKVEVTKIEEWSAREIERNEKKVEEYKEFLLKVVKRVAEHKARITGVLKAASEEAKEKQKLAAKQLEEEDEAL